MSQRNDHSFGRSHQHPGQQAGYGSGVGSVGGHAPHGQPYPPERLGEQGRIPQKWKWWSFAGIVAGVVLLLAGGATMVEGSIASAQRTVTYDQLVREAPRFGWVLVEDATVDLNEAFVEGGRGPNSIYVPLRSRSSPDRQPRLLLKVNDESLTRRVKRGERFGAQSWRVEGTISLLGPDNATEGSLAQRLGVEDPSGLIMIESRDRPLGIFMGVGISVAGILLFLTSLLVLLRLRRRANAARW